MRCKYMVRKKKKKRRKARDNTKNGITRLNYLIITTSRYFDKQGFQKSYEAHRITAWLVFWCSNTMFFTPYYLSQVCYESNCCKKAWQNNKCSRPNQTYPRFSWTQNRPTTLTNKSRQAQLQNSLGPGKWPVDQDQQCHSKRSRPRSSSDPVEQFLRPRWTASIQFFPLFIQMLLNFRIRFRIFCHDRIWKVW